MKMVFMTIVLVLTTISQLYAFDTCNDETISAVQQQQMLPEPIVQGLANKEFWFPLVTANDALYGVKSSRLSCGDLITEDTLVANLTTTYENGWGIKSIYMTDKDTYISEIQYDGGYETHPFVCGENLIGSYRCYTGSTSGTTPFLDVVVSMSLSLEDVKEELESCKLKMAEIVPGVEFVQLERPS